ncbi:unnamed protein product [Nezara viridula]|uniref:Ferric-chelate reductase 1 homolog n=1 Tax=Nezara viridula TaxID=85310 RepID=A0A9P0E9N8_NEZVI|nr:unnamed protein product [Nezara viridula]
MYSIFLFSVLGMQIWLVPILLVTNFLLTDSFKSGAPVSKCSTMIPHHIDIAPQTTSSSFLLDANPINVENGLCKVKLHSTNRDNFAGFLIQARVSSDNNTVGSFVKFPDDAKAINCLEIANSGLTHASNVKRDVLEANWIAPENFEGEVHFIGTVVANFTTFWTGIISQNLPISKRSTSEKTFSAASKLKDFLNGCGTNKKCIGHPADCITSEKCDALVAISYEGDQYIFEMYGKDSHYVAIGFSEDNKMGGDMVIECINQNSNEVKAYKSWNIPNQKQNKRVEEQVGISLIHGKYTDGDIDCKVSAEVISEVENVKFDFEKNPYYLLLAAGKSLKENSVGFHDVAYDVTNNKQLLSDLSLKKNNDIIYDGCETEKNCFGYPDNCIINQNCEGLVTVSVQGTRYIFEMKGKSDGYIATGLSRDNKMGGDSVMECVHEPGDKINVYMSYNKAGEKSNTRRKIIQTGINMLNSTFIDGTIYCKFSRDVNTVIENEIFDLSNDKYFILLAAGSSIKDGAIGFHDNFYVVSGQQRLLSDIAAFSTSSKLLLRLHGSFMVAAWLGCTSIGIVLARYFKQTWVDSSLCAKDLWFAWHRMFMLVTWCLTLAGFVIIFVELGGWVGPNSQSHALMGCITTVLCFIQPIGAAFRPHPTARKRPVFNWLHWFIGNTAHICSIITIFLAVPLNKAELPDWVDWLLVVFVAAYVFIHLVLSCAGCLTERKLGKRVNSFPMKDITASRNALNAVDRKQDAPLSSLRKLMLFVHIVVMTAITGSVIIVIALAPVEVQWNSLKNKFMPT